MSCNLDNLKLSFSATFQIKLSIDGTPYQIEKEEDLSLDDSEAVDLCIEKGNLSSYFFNSFEMRIGQNLRR